MSQKESRAKTLQERFGFVDSDLKTPRHDEIMIWLQANAEPITDSIWKRGWHSPIDTYESIYHASIEWEYPITNGQKFTIGFIDMRVECTACLAPGRWVQREFFFEVKSSIPSIGELMRQINLYRLHKPQGYFIVVSPDESAKEVLRSQHIHFVKYDPERD